MLYSINQNKFIVFSRKLYCKNSFTIIDVLSGKTLSENAFF